MASAIDMEDLFLGVRDRPRGLGGARVLGDELLTGGRVECVGFKRVDITLRTLNALSFRLEPLDPGGVKTGPCPYVRRCVRA